MGKSRFEALETAIREGASVSMESVESEVRIKTLEGQLTRLQRELDGQIQRIRQTPVDKNALQAKVKSDRDMAIARCKNQIDQDKNKRENAVNSMSTAGQVAYDRAMREAEHALEQAKTNVANMIAANKLAEAEAARQLQEVTDRANFEHDMAMASIDDTDKTAELQIDKARQEFEAKTEKISIEIMSLQKGIDLVNERTKRWERFYDDVVNISSKMES